MTIQCKCIFVDYFKPQSGLSSDRTTTWIIYLIKPNYFIILFRFYPVYYLKQLLFGEYRLVGASDFNS